MIRQVGFVLLDALGHLSTEVCYVCLAVQSVITCKVMKLFGANKEQGDVVGIRCQNFSVGDTAIM